MTFLDTNTHTTRYNCALNDYVFVWITGCDSVLYYYLNYKGVWRMNSKEVLNTLATYFMAEIKNTITINDNELIVELSNNQRVRIRAKV